MREDLVEILCCPESGAPLELVHVESYFELDGRRHVVNGLLRSTGEGGWRFPVMGEIPRLVPPAMFSEEEVRCLGRHRDADAWQSFESSRRVEPEVVSEAELEAEIRSRMEKQYDLPPSGSGEETPETAGARQRCEGEIRYMTAEARGTNKEKYVPLLRPHIDDEGFEVSSLLETGGNFPGLTRNLTRVYEPSRAVVANIQILFPMAFKTPDRSIQAVRADVQALPFQPRSFDLVVTAFMLEHVPDWRRGLRCLMACGRRSFIAFGPNKWFPFEVGHLDAPLAGMLPKPLAARVTWLWLALNGRRRPLHRLEAILGEVFHVGSGAFAREVKRRGGQAVNLFPALVEGILADEKAPSTGPRRWLKRYPRLAVLTARFLTRLGLEPQMYYWIRPSSADGI